MFVYVYSANMKSSCRLFGNMFELGGAFQDA